MKIVHSIALLTMGLLWSSKGFSDDARFSAADSRENLAVFLSDTWMLANSENLPHWRPLSVAGTSFGPADRPRSVAELNFEEIGRFSRFKNLRGLSLLTLAETGRTRLFLGVNGDGLVGLHFSVFPVEVGHRYLEFSRMPYLRRSNLSAASER